MSFSVLITQCLQRDFIGLIEPHAPLPNALHVGREEARRLLSPEPTRGPLAQLMQWARQQPEDDLEIVHIRDWHNPEDPQQKNHLERFGAHCIANTPGAELVLGLDSQVDARSNERFVDSLTLNDFVGTNLGEVFDAIAQRAGGRSLRVGVIGVWTEAKVSFLLYELLTRCGIQNLATCSALTASASRSQHFNALDQLRKVLGVDVFESVGDFAAWLRPGADELRPPSVPHGMRPKLSIEGGAQDLSEENHDLISYLYRGSSRLELDPLGGGFSGAEVYRVRSWDALGHEQASTVLKLGERALIASERVAFERVESILGNDAPSVLGFADFGERAGLKYAFAAMGAGKVQTFESLYTSGAPLERVESVLDDVFGDILGRFYSAAQYERLPLLDYYTFDSAYADGVAATVTRVLDEDEPGATIEFPGGYVVPNVARFYAEQLDELPAPHGEFHYVSYVHGDLNGANILLDGRDNVWLIDFFHAHRGHVLRDLAKLENDLLYIFTPVVDDEALEEALLITRALRRVEDLREPLPETLEGLEREPFVRAWRVVRMLRAFVAKLCREDRAPVQMSTALMRYAVHTLSFEQSSPLQKKWALAAAGGFAEDIVETAQRNFRLRVDWVDHTPIPDASDHGAGRLGLTICPGRRDHNRELSADLDAICQTGAGHVLSLLTSREMEWAGVEDIAERAREAGLVYRREPIVDQGVPTLETMRELVTWVCERMDSGDDVVLHCMGGLGRSGTVAACVLTHLGMGAEDAISAVRDARGPRAVESADQVRFVSDFATRMV